MTDYAESDLDRALLGQPSKRVEEQLRAEHRPSWYTEYDERLAPLRRVVLIRGGIGLLGVAAILASLILIGAASAWISVVMLAACVVGFFVSFIGAFLPTKLMAFDSLKIIRETREVSIEGAKTSAKAVQAGFEAVKADVKAGMETLNDHLKGIESGIRRFNHVEPPMDEEELAELQRSVI